MPLAEVQSARTVSPAARVAGEVAGAGEKAIGQRVLRLACLAEGESWVDGLPEGEDVRATVACLRALGADIQRSDRTARIRGAGLRSFATPHGNLDCANSGTTMRLLLGLLAGSSISATLDGDASLRRRPMARVIDPLERMGARIESLDGRAPLAVGGTPPHGPPPPPPAPPAPGHSARLPLGPPAPRAAPAP